MNSSWLDEGVYSADIEDVNSDLERFDEDKDSDGMSNIYFLNQPLSLLIVFIINPDNAILLFIIFQAIINTYWFNSAEL